jgi:hypothetical protein
MAPACSRASAAALAAVLAVTLAPCPARGAEAFLGKGLRQDCSEGNGTLEGCLECREGDGLDLTNACRAAHDLTCRATCDISSCEHRQGANCWQCRCDIGTPELHRRRRPLSHHASLHLDEYVRGVCGEGWCAKVRDGRDDCGSWTMSTDCGSQAECWEGKEIDVSTACRAAHDDTCGATWGSDSCQHQQGAYCWQCHCDTGAADPQLDEYVRGVCGEGWCAKLRDGLDDHESWMMSADCR